MSPERMGMPPPVSRKIQIGAPRESSAHEGNSPTSSKDFQEATARKVLAGIISPEQLALNYGPTVMEAVMKRVEAISAYESFASVPEKPGPAPKTPHPLSSIIPRVLEHYNKADKTEDDEQEYLDLLSELKNDKQFQKILEQYAPLIQLDPDRTEAYEMKAMKDFVELNSRLVA